MSNLTNLENKVLNAIIDECESDYSSTVESLSECIDLTKPQIKGVLGSLVKKSEITIGDAEIRGGKEFKDIWPLRKVAGEWQTLCWGEWN